MIRNTKTEARTLSDLLPGAIERSEARGQAELVADSALPIDGFDRLPAEWGIVNNGEREGDPLFYSVTLPVGWRLVPTDHAMWSDLMDAAGVRRAAVFYKAAFYDRKAHVRAID